MTEAQDVRRRFLQNAARTVFLSSPSTSRHLLTQSVEVTISRTLNSRTIPRKACEACGNLLLSGWTASSRFTTRRAKHNAKVIPPAGLRKENLHHRCSVCHRVTKEAVDPEFNPRNKKIPTATVPNKQREEAPCSNAIPEKSNKSNSKKRAKARKDCEGLQALLDKSKRSKSTPSLNLMDLMKK
ncbi:uncharacterized protein Z518_10856 [Rhinocladiella mackenziei CBS 650.93]|uniref:Uncharacterized protein n=1 Tax=Rhinocladiella mackenziei CBS 650.93 TaxID=1442369 RepID=A0A0D2I2F5_9EURO|nr:uncharacterized protein Z518_10856 [Rhinocladiella mackenziei CBS 650.93]KIW99928.1 hypothetical protein Z518_10856 [Rhinocladiella mackenziei CBS 650.93]